MGICECFESFLFQLIMRLVFSILFLIELSITADPDIHNPRKASKYLAAWTLAKSRKGKSPTGKDEVLPPAGSEEGKFHFAANTIVKEKPRYIPVPDPVKEQDDAAGEWKLVKSRKRKSTAKMAVKVAEPKTTTTTSAPAEEDKPEKRKKDPKDDLIVGVQLPACRSIVVQKAPVLEEQQRLRAAIQNVIESMASAKQDHTFDSRPLPDILAEAIAATLTKDELKLLISRIGDIVVEHRITKVFYLPALPQAQALLSALNNFYKSAKYRKIAVTSDDSKEREEALSKSADRFAAGSQLIREILCTKCAEGPLVF